MKIPAYTPAAVPRRGLARRILDRIRRRGIRPRDRKIAGFAVYLLVVAWVMFGIDQRGVVVMVSGWVDGGPPERAQKSTLGLRTH